MLRHTVCSCYGMRCVVCLGCVVMTGDGSFNLVASIHLSTVALGLAFIRDDLIQGSGRPHVCVRSYDVLPVIGEFGWSFSSFLIISGFIHVKLVHDSVHP